VYFVFDLLHHDGRDWRAEPLEVRKRALRRLLARASAEGPLRYADHVVGHGPEFFAEVCAQRLEGVISKRRDCPYTSGRSPVWLKSKCWSRQEFVIGGFTDPDGTRSGIGALLVGTYDDQGRLAFAGKVGTGFTHRMLVDLRRRLEAIEQGGSPFVVTPPTGWLGRHAHWVRPELVAEVAFSEWTSDGRLRQPSFQGLRADKSPSEVRRDVAVAPPRERASSPKASGRRGTIVEVAGQRLTHADRPLYPARNLTKLDVASYYERVADWILPHVRGRPLTLVRCPKGVDGGCFYMRHSRVWSPPSLRTVRIREKTKRGEYLVVDDLTGLIGLVQMDVLEIHTWNAHVESLEHPDRLVLDLDPGPDVAWRDVVETARLLRAALEGVGLESFVKTTGGKGLHVVVPLEPDSDWDTCLAFSRLVAETFAEESPRRFTTAMAKRGRERKILIDYMRNNRTSTSVSAYSTRASPSATVSLPVAWEDLGPRLTSDRFTIENAPAELAGRRADPWARYFEVRQSLPASMRGRGRTPSRPRRRR
jgi:bifunctional non-homologous end joining protein LigD